MMRLLALLLAACGLPTSITVTSDGGGTCPGLTFPASCVSAPQIERALEDQLPCDTCVVYRCDCEARAFCKVCTAGAAETSAAWGCTPRAAAWCLDVAP